MNAIGVVTDASRPGAIAGGSKAMEVHFSPETESVLTRIAARQGRDTEELVQEILSRYLEQEVRFAEAVLQKGIASADHGHLRDHDEILARIKKRFDS